jgi:hypothetical protein
VPRLATDTNSGFLRLFYDENGTFGGTLDVSTLSSFFSIFSSFFLIFFAAFFAFLAAFRASLFFLDTRSGPPILVAAWTFAWVSQAKKRWTTFRAWGFPLIASVGRRFLRGDQSFAKKQTL